MRPRASEVYIGMTWQGLVSLSSWRHLFGGFFPPGLWVISRGVGSEEGGGVEQLGEYDRALVWMALSPQLRGRFTIAIVVVIVIAIVFITVIISISISSCIIIIIIIIIIITIIICSYVGTGVLAFLSVRYLLLGHWRSLFPSYHLAEVKYEHKCMTP